MASSIQDVTNTVLEAVEELATNSVELFRWTVFKDYESLVHIFRNADGIINWGNTNASGTINLYTELQPCPSCDGVIAQFKQQYPNIKLNIF